ncbi:membrane protein [Anopheles sinensis]|uniref:Membrane protein n=1 Tax=Anopheles sinensis TaxID=74873 RepID=A0A084WK92_ANOSI|nr:membrane protein [Anopheles sinensis]
MSSTSFKVKPACPDEDWKDGKDEGQPFRGYSLHGWRCLVYVHAKLSIHRFIFYLR